MRWSANLAYIIGLITSDGNLSIDGRHLQLTSKDLGQIETFARILKLTNKISLKNSGFVKNKKFYYIQFGSVVLHRFLLKIGLMPNKSRVLGELKIPRRYFADFFRGCLDGDGYTYSYWDPRWKSSFMLYLGLVSASLKFLEWVKGEVSELYGLEGKINYVGKSAYKLVYAKHASVQILNELYYSKRVACLARKKYKIDLALSIIYEHAEVGKLADPLP